MERGDSIDIELHASYEDYKAFLNNVVWLDIVREVTAQKEIIIDLLGSSSNTTQLFRLQGQLEACNDFLSMPQDIIHHLEERFAQNQVSEYNIKDIEDEPEDPQEEFYTTLLEKFKE